MGKKGIDKKRVDERLQLHFGLKVKILGRSRNLAKISHLFILQIKFQTYLYSLLLSSTKIEHGPEMIPSYLSLIHI